MFPGNLQQGGEGRKSGRRHAALRRILGVEVPRRRQQRKPGQVALAAQREAEREETAHAVAEQHRRRGFLSPQSIQRALKAAGDVVGEREIALLGPGRSEEHTSELQSLNRISYAVFGLKKKTTKQINIRPLL